MMAQVSITLLNAALQFRILKLGMVVAATVLAVTVVTESMIQSTQVVTVKMVTAVMLVKMIQLSKASNVAELIQIDSNF